MMSNPDAMISGAIILLCGMLIGIVGSKLLGNR